MKNLIIAFAILITAPALADDGPPVVNVDVNVSTGVSQFAGFSIGTIDGGQGMLAMHALCQLDFGPDARMCTSKEYFTSPNAAEPLVRSWLHPTIVGVTATGRSLRQMTDFSGFAPRFEFGSNPFPSLSCNGWQNGPVGSGLTLGALQGGKPSIASCGELNTVTCCAPAQ